MSKKIFQSVKGMRDLRGEESLAIDQVLAAVKKQLVAYGYQAFHPPILESTALFSRSIGEATDVVEKEMFTFDDHGDSLTLRPEATAGIARAVVQHGLTFGVHKIWTAGPMFRRERPQKGRYRQFHQVSVETFGVAAPEQDAEHLLMLAELWQLLGIADAVKLSVNTLATPEVRQNYRNALVAYFRQHYEALDSDSQRRLDKNPLRILDSKNPQMQSLIMDAPKLSDYLDQASVAHFERVLACLDSAGIDYLVDPTLVRGLDYYNHTVYEWITDKLGAQGTICGGGRYDGLTEHLGGKATPAVGFGLGIDRTALLVQTVGQLKKEPVPLAYFVLLGVPATRQGLVLASVLRQYYPGQTVLTHLSDSSMKAQLKKADQCRATFAIILGDNELQTQTATVKHLATGHQDSVAFGDLTVYLSNQQ